MAQFVNTHSPEGCREKTAKQIISKVSLSPLSLSLSPSLLFSLMTFSDCSYQFATVCLSVCLSVCVQVKALQRLDSSEREVENKMAFSKFEKEHVERGHVEATPTERYGEPRS